MALRAEISVIDDDYSVVGSVTVPLFERDVEQVGTFAESVVVDPDDCKVYKFTFQANVVGQIAPKREESTFPKEGDVVRIIGNDNPTHHNFKLGGLAEVVDVDSFGTVSATGVGLRGTTITQFVSRDDYILE